MAANTAAAVGTTAVMRTSGIGSSMRVVMPTARG